jgi:hypothetical protein
VGDGRGGRKEGERGSEKFEEGRKARRVVKC